MRALSLCSPRYTAFDRRMHGAEAGILSSVNASGEVFAAVLTSPRRSFGAGQEGGEYLVLLLHLPLKRLRAMPRFLWYALSIMR